MSDIKLCFTSRFRNGLILEADFSQLEVVGLAVLSGDPVLKDDILSGRDMHRQRAADGNPDRAILSQAQITVIGTLAVPYIEKVQRLSERSRAKRSEAQDTLMG